ncbi:MAG: GAF domain-containing protein [Thermoflexales bacterium]|nr:GAF domain-containing protein [Thermoflexales bacterium]
MRSKLGEQVTNGAELVPGRIERKRTKSMRRGETCDDLVEGTFMSVYRTTPEGCFLAVSPALVQMLGYPDRKTLLATNVAELYPDPQIRKQWQALMEREGIVRDVETQVRRHDGAMIWVRDTALAVRDAAGRVLYYAGSLEDITGRKQLERQIQDSLERYAQQVHIITEVAQEIASAPALDELYRRVVSLVKERFGYSHVQIFVDPGSRTMVLAEGYGDVGEKMKAAGYNQPYGQGIVGTTASTGRPLLASDVSQDPRWVSCLYLPDTQGELAVPIKLRDKMLGVLDVQSDVAGALTREDQVMLLGLAGQIAIAIQNTNLLEQSHAMLAKAQESEHMLCAIIDATPDWIFIKDQAHRYRLVNQGYANSLSLNPQDFIGKTDLEIGFSEEQVKGDPARGLRGFWTHDQMIMESGQPHAYRGDPVVVDGQIHYFHSIKTPMRDTEGRIWGVLAFCRDVTEREQLMARLEHRAVQLQTAAEVSRAASEVLAEEKLLTTSVDLIRDGFDLYYAGVFLVDEAGEYAWLRAGTGEAGRKMLAGQHKLAVEDTSMIGWCVAHRQARIALDVEREAVRFKNPWLPKTRSEMALPLITRGEVIGALTVQSERLDAFSQDDITVMLTMAGQLANAIANARLYMAAQEARSAAEDAWHAAERANRAKSEFLSSMSHELRTPLNGILGYAQILKRGKDLTPLQKDGLNVIQQSGEHLLTLINDILDLSKIEAGKLELAPRDFKFLDFLNGVAGIIRVRAQDKGLGFALHDVPPLPETAHADDKRLRQVLINLLSNAVKFTDEGSVTMRVQGLAREVAAQGSAYRVRFEVVDTGVGIAPEDLDKIFRPFEQAGNARKMSEGTGLGLSITRRLVELLGGELHVQSTLGQGSTFWFQVLLPEAQGAITAERAASWREIVGYAGAPRKVLVVDDKAHNRSVMLHILAPLGFEVVETDNGADAIRLAQELRPDLIVMDMIMPGMTGFEAVQRIRQIPELARTPILGASASVFEQDQHKVQLAGCDAFLEKPVALPKLLAAVKEYLGITWVYSEEVELAAEPESAREPAEIIPPPPDILQALLNLAGRGDLLELEEQAGELARTHPEYTSFAEKLRQMAADFHDEQAIAFISKYSNAPRNVREV